MYYRVTYIPTDKREAKSMEIIVELDHYAISSIMWAIDRYGYYSAKRCLITGVKTFEGERVKIR